MQIISPSTSVTISICSYTNQHDMPLPSEYVNFQVCREADGFQRSLVSPEAGLRRLVHDSVETVLIPVDTTVRRVHQVLIDASRCDICYMFPLLLRVLMTIYCRAVCRICTVKP